MHEVGVGILEVVQVRHVSAFAEVDSCHLHGHLLYSDSHAQTKEAHRSGP